MDKATKAIRVIRDLVYSERREISVVLIYGLASGILSLVVPIGVQTLVNKVAFGALNQPVLFLVLAVFICMSAAAVFRGVQIVVTELFQRRLFSKVALELAYRLPRVRSEAHSSVDLTDRVNRFLDVVTLQKSGAMLLLDGFTLVLQAVAGLTLLAFYHPFLLAFDVVLVVSVVFILFGLGWGASSTSIEESSAKYRVLAWLEDVAQRNFSLRSRTAREFVLMRTDDLVQQYLRARTAHFRILMRQVVGSLALQSVASAGLLGIGALLVIRNQLTLGQLVAAEIVVTTVLSSLQKFQKHLETYYDLVAAASKVDDVLALPQERKDGEPLFEKSDAISLEVRGIEYEAAKGWRLPPIDFSVKAGASLALLGSNGTGKSTLVDIIYGLKAAKSGSVLVNGQDIRDLSLEQFRTGIAVVRQAALFEDTVANNVRFGNPPLSMDQVRGAIDLVGLAPALEKFEQGLQLQVSELGSPLTAAESHRLALARALAAKPKLLVIDEWLDAVDETTLKDVQRILFSASRETTLILCTHRRDLAEKCETVVDLDQISVRETA